MHFSVTEGRKSSNLRNVIYVRPLNQFSFFLGVTVKPEAGSALYWFNHDAIEENDSRTFHLGCPVGVGNKWIANKWIKWTAQMCNYPCTATKQEFSIHKPMMK